MSAIPNKVMLITYPDSLGGDLKALARTAETYLTGAVGSMHILPFFPSSGDRGFSPLTYEEVEPTFGGWADIEALSKDYTLMCDMMVNHISRQSREFEDYMQHGEASPYAPMFFDYDAFWGGKPPAEEYALLYRRSDKPLFVTVMLPDGTEKRLWCSFTAQQIDLDTDHPATRDYIFRNLAALGSHGISLVRLDAYGYITKVRGTNCFFVEPKVWELIAACGDTLSRLGMTLLPEVHAPYETALKIAGQGYYTYDFVLPMLMLHTLLSGDARAMKHWFTICPRNQFTVLDTHDGVGVHDAAGILTEEQAQAVIDRIEPNLSYAFKPIDESKKRYKKSYQLYGTYFSMLNEDERAYLLARTLQLFAPGIPQVYYVGLLAGVNQMDFPIADHRFINRKNYAGQELEAEFERPIVQSILSLLRLRNTHPAFDGTLTIADTADDRLSLLWQNGQETAVLEADVKGHAFTVSATRDGRMECVFQQY